MPSPDGKISQLKIKIAIQRYSLSDEFPQTRWEIATDAGRFTGGIYLYVPDVDKVFDKAIARGGKSAMP